MRTAEIVVLAAIILPPCARSSRRRPSRGRPSLPSERPPATLARNRPLMQAHAASRGPGPPGPSRPVSTSS
eukprot:7116630-Lingulodinium_polyedra.AAC.1